MATYFSVEALKFLRGLKRNNDRFWFEAPGVEFEKERRGIKRQHGQGTISEPQ